MFKAGVIHMRNPVRVQVDRDLSTIEEQLSIEQLLLDRKLISVEDDGSYRRLSPFIVSTSLRQTTPDDIYCLSGEWKRLIQYDEVILIQAMPLGQNGSRIVALIAIAVLAAYTGGAAAGLAGGIGTVGGGIAFAVVSTAVTIAGTALMNAVMPLPKPKAATSNTSPNYGIAADGNLARVNESVPVLYGRFRSFPDFAAQPYTENLSGGVYLYELFCITQGDMEMESITIGGTPIDSFTDLDYELIPPGGLVSLFPDNVVTSEAVTGIELVSPQDSSPFADPNWTINYPVGAPGTKTKQLGIDVSFPSGIFEVNGEGKQRGLIIGYEFQAQAIDDDGNPTGDWFSLAYYHQTQSFNAPKNVSYFYPVPEGRYQVRARQDDIGITSGNTQIHKIFWTGLRAYLPSQLSYGDCTMLAIKAKATNAINTSTQRQVAVIGTRKLPIWNGSTWSAPTTTRSIAWALCDLFRNTSYGAKWADNRLQMDRILALDGVWATRGDKFDGIFDTKTTVWEAAKSICRVGRAIPLYYAGVLDVIRDAPRSLRVLMLNPGTIIANSLKIKYVFPTYDTPDYVISQYIDPTTWQATNVTCALDDSPKLVPKTLDFSLGITDHDQAFREGIYASACNRDQRRLISVTTELAGLIPSYGDLVGLSHDVPGWGSPGTVYSIDVETGIVELSDPVDFASGTTYYIAFQKRNGSADGPYQCIAGADEFHVVLNTTSPMDRANIYVSDRISEMPTTYAFGAAEAQFLDCVVLGGKPTNDGKVNLSLVNYAPSVHIAEIDTAVPPPLSPSNLLPPNQAPTINGGGTAEVPGTPDGGTIVLYVQPVDGAIAYEFEISYDDGVSWINLGVSRTNTIRIASPPGNWIFRARAYGANGQPGEWTEIPIEVVGKPWPLGQLATFTATTLVFGIRLDWTFPAGTENLDAGATEIRYSTTSDFASSSVLSNFSYPTNTCTLSGLDAGEGYFFWARLISSTTGDPGPWNPLDSEAGLHGMASDDAGAILSYLGNAIGEEQLTVDLTSKIENGSATVNGRLDDIEEELGVMQGEFDSITGIITRFDPDMAGMTTKNAGRTSGRVGVYSEISARQEGDFYVGRRVDTVVSVANDANTNAALAVAQVETESETRASADAALATQVTTVSATVGGISADVQTNAQAVANLDGEISATYNIKVQIDPGTGKYIAAGMAIGVTNDSGIAQSQIIFQADLLSLINVTNGVVTTPFTILSGVTYINSAFIQDGTITNAKIGGTIQSSALDSTGNPLWAFAKTGAMTIRGSASGGRIQLDGNGLKVYDAAGTLRVEVGLF